MYTLEPPSRVPEESVSTYPPEPFTKASAIYLSYLRSHGPNVELARLAKLPGKAFDIDLVIASCIAYRQRYLSNHSTDVWLDGAGICTDRTS